MQGLGTPVHTQSVYWGTPDLYRPWFVHWSIIILKQIQVIRNS